MVSSETEPSVRIFGRDGIEQTSLPVPARFAVRGTTPAGEATANATLQGLTLSPDGRQLVAAMEGALSGDLAEIGDATWHRFLVDRQGRDGWTLRKQIAHRTEPGQRIACPTLGATSTQPQANPLLDNYGGMAVTGEVRSHGKRLVGISLISDDDFGATQTTRLLNVAVALGRR